MFSRKFFVEKGRKGGLNGWKHLTARQREKRLRDLEKARKSKPKAKLTAEMNTIV